MIAASLGLTPGACRPPTRNRVVCGTPDEGNMPVSESTFLRIATRQAPAEALPALVYDDESDQAYVMDDDGALVAAATDPRRPPKTKKADIERGEDMKGW